MLKKLLFKLQNFIQHLLSHSLVNKREIIKLMKHFKADEYGHLANEETGDLGYGWWHYCLIRQSKPKRLLCIGSRHGFIPALMATACRDNGFGHVYFVDAGFGEDDKNHWSGVGFWKTSLGQNIFHDYGLSRHISLYVMTTQEFKKKCRLLNFDYIYIDGNHSFSGVKFDFETFWPKLNQHGYMLFHDIAVEGNLPEGEYGVAKQWKKIKSKEINFLEILDIQSGLGVLQKT